MLGRLGLDQACRFGELGGDGGQNRLIVVVIGNGYPERAPRPDLEEIFQRGLVLQR